MCGIVGIVGWRGRRCDKREIEAMSEAIAHRGPDGSGLFMHDSVALGHRRLAIIDLDAGRQPMSNDDDSVHVTYNGELYNFLELREELRGKGYTFRTRSDTEVILRAYEAWGSDCVKHFRGMFAFGIADLRLRRVFLARDHFGIKPLYYRIGSDYFAFASELGALRRVADTTPSGNIRAVDTFLKLQYIPQPETIYAQVAKLPPASTIQVSFDGDVGTVHRYWQPEFNLTETRAGQDWEDEFRSTLRESVRTHTIADVPYGVFLSGGIDSTLVAMDLAKVTNHPVLAFNIDFDDEAHSERRYAEEAARHAGVTLVSELVHEPTRDDLAALVKSYGEPFADSSSIPTYYVSKLARREVPMVLSGDGGDEFFAGYLTHQWWLSHRPRLRQHAYRLAARPSRVALIRLAQSALWRITGRRADSADEWERLVWMIGDVQRHQLWRKPFRQMVFDPIKSFEEAAAAAGTRDPILFAQQMDLATYLPGDILTKVDIASMAHGLEVRTPLIDLHVFNLASRLPTRERLGLAPDGSLTGKILPKRVLARVLGEAFVYRRKQGFAVPRARWLMPGMRTRKTLDELLAAPDTRLNKWFDLSQVLKAAKQHSRECNMSGILWQFLVLALWLDLNREVDFG